MNNWKKYALAAVIAATAGFAWIKSSHRNIPSNLRDAPADNVGSQSFDTAIPVIEKENRDIPVPTPAVPVETSAGSVRPCGESSNLFGICPGDMVYQVRSRGRDRVGTVWDVFSNGEAQVCFMKYCLRDTENVDIRKLSKPQPCYKDICVGKSVMDSDNNISLVNTVFANGKVLVLFDKSSPSTGARARLEIRNAELLVTTQNCFGNICANDIVMDDRDAVAAVGAVFSNGKIGVDYLDMYGHRDPYQRLSVRNSRQLTTIQAVSCLGEICVNDTVAGQSGKVGRVLAAYSNGKALLDFYGAGITMVDASGLAKSVVSSK